jgi:hypothetical protein
MIRLAICQPLIPRYRVPVFDLLGAQEGIALTVFAGTGALEGDTESDEPMRFEHVHAAFAGKTFELTGTLQMAPNEPRGPTTT